MNKQHLFMQKVNALPWRRTPTENTTIGLKNLQRGLSAYTFHDVNNPPSGWEDYFNLATPIFQRANDKWSLKQQVLFVQNVLSGFVPDITLFQVSPKDHMETGYGSCQILDGLQRLTAISKFLSNNLSVFDDQIKFKDIKDIPYMRNMNARVNVKIFLFDSHEEAIQFYIDMNEGITHSEDDIQKAKQCFRMAFKRNKE